MNNITFYLAMFLAYGIMISVIILAIMEYIDPANDELYSRIILILLMISVIFGFIPYFFILN